VRDIRGYGGRRLVRVEDGYGGVISTLIKQGPRWGQCGKGCDLVLGVAPEKEAAASSRLRTDLGDEALRTRTKGTLDAGQTGRWLVLSAVEVDSPRSEAATPGGAGLRRCGSGSRPSTPAGQMGCSPARRPVPAHGGTWISVLS
jgi:hypothetical protein